MTLELRSEEKAAALVVAIGSDAASDLLQFLTEEEVEALAAEVARLGLLQPEVIEQVLEEAVMETEALRGIQTGGIDYARELLTEWKGTRGQEIIDRLTAHMNVAPFSFVRDIDPDQIVHVLKDEHPQTIALILAYQPPPYAAQVLARFDPETQARVALRLGMMGRTTPEVISKVEKALQGRLGKVQPSEVTVRGGVEDLAELLNNTDRATEKGILDAIGRIEPQLAEQVRALMFVFEDIETLDDKSVQRVLQEVDSKDLSLAMKGVSKNVRELILSNMSQRASETLLEELELLGAVRRSDVEQAQANVVAVIRRLEESGDIVIARAGESDLIE